ncbi:TRAP transporter large permease subunit [Marinomonas sp. GJ51-6]|uniref:TRAP transporter large permease n=1 Tax=Marinomonas sp. GJ51-6 TaxID=2992802 RepID=UPI0029345D1D|nr:TRAP transporter large permease subunit [Marinomonas sp. GJ51-6]WOD07572.1 TRAP transporter large permease subunit [Marinomonas sp. GJ51-6]
MGELFVFLLFSSFMLLLFSGFPVAFVLGGVGVLFASIGSLLTLFEIYDVAELRTIGFVANRTFSTISSYSLIPMSMFIFMGYMLDRSGIAERLIIAMRRILGNTPGGLAIAVVLIGVVLAASTGIIGASVVLLSTIALPTMFKAGYAKWISAGTVGATGCLGILMPPSIMLVVMGDQLRIPVGDLFLGAILPGLLLATSFVLFLFIYALLKPSAMPKIDMEETTPMSRFDIIKDLSGALFAPLLLVLAVLGSIIAGIASPTEASGIGAAGATFLAWCSGRLKWKDLQEVCNQTGRSVAFLYALIFGASCFSVVLRGYGGDEVIENALHALPLSPEGVLFCVILIVFLLGFFLDWMEIVLIIAPLVVPILVGFGFDPAWVAILIALCLQTSFLTPPVGMALFYIRSAASDISMKEIYRGAIPFVLLQLSVLALTAFFPAIVTWLPS